MKKLFSIVICATTLLACHKGGHRTIVVRNNNSSVKIEYHGQVLFNADTTGIASISPGGYVEFEKEGRSVKAEDQHGKIVYEINGDYKRQRLNADEQEIVTSVVHDLAHYGRNIR